MSLSADDIQHVVALADVMAVDHPVLRVEDFFARGLSLTLMEIEAVFSDSAISPIGVQAIASLTKRREEILRDACEVPPFVIYTVAGKYFICGVVTYFQQQPQLSGWPAGFAQRVGMHAEIRNALIRLDKGHNLEALAAALLECACEYGEATRGSGDQGVDAVAWNHLIRIEHVFLGGAIELDRIWPGQRVMVVASSKATVKRSKIPAVINPAHIRELIGGWLIQRSENGRWKSMGIQMLTPLQLILVTTYRLSAESQSQCNTLGVQVWSLPELIFLICRYAPDSIFRAGGGCGFSATDFDQWWAAKDGTRLRA